MLVCSSHEVVWAKVEDTMNNLDIYDILENVVNMANEDEQNVTVSIKV